VVDPEDVEMLQDLVVAAINEAMRAIEEISAERMSRVTGGMGMPRF
jgi:DNA-binding protein YbaB